MEQNQIVTLGIIARVLLWMTSKCRWTAPGNLRVLVTTRNGDPADVIVEFGADFSVRTDAHGSATLPWNASGNPGFLRCPRLRTVLRRVVFVVDDSRVVRLELDS